MNITGHGQNFCGVKYCKGKRCCLYSPSNTFSETEIFKSGTLSFTKGDLLPIDKKDLGGASSHHGAILKYSYTDNKDNKFIVKVTDSQHFYSAPVEQLCNSLYRSLGVHVPDSRIITVDGKASVISANFVSQKTPVKLIHLCSYIRDEKDYTFENILKVIKNNSSYPDVDIKTFVETTILDSIVGNIDRHGRNLAFLNSGDQCCLSPIYDNYSFTSTVGSKSSQGSIRCEGRDSFIENYIAAARDSGNGHHVDKLLDRININKIQKMINTHDGIDDDTKQVMSSYVEEQYRRVKK